MTVRYRVSELLAFSHQAVFNDPVEVFLTGDRLEPVCVFSRNIGVALVGHG
ncbi:hypothetical protein [Schaalia turicensis]|uniref:hypothetical protein n=1 Tax=Schaalia turicensis TaxID=131111 RepID=UPI0034A581F2